MSNSEASDNRSNVNRTKASKAEKKAPKQKAIAFVLAISLGFFGAHRFYLGRRESAAEMLYLSLGLIVSALLADFWLSSVEISSEVSVGIARIIDNLLRVLINVVFLGFGLLGLWVVLDLFSIPRFVREYNEEILAIPSKSSIPTKENDA